MVQVLRLLLRRIPHPKSHSWKSGFRYSPRYRKEKKPKPALSSLNLGLLGLPGKITIKQNKQTKKIDQLARHTNGDGAQLLDLQSRTGGSCPLSYSNPVYASHLFWIVYHDVMPTGPIFLLIKNPLKSLSVSIFIARSTALTEARPSQWPSHWPAHTPPLISLKQSTKWNPT